MAMDPMHWSSDCLPSSNPEPMAMEVCPSSPTSNTSSPASRKRQSGQWESRKPKRQKPVAEASACSPASSPHQRRSTHLQRQDSRPLATHIASLSLNTVRINIIHSFGHVTSHDVSRGLKLSDLFRMHHSSGGQKPCKGLVLQQTGEIEIVNGLHYWTSIGAPTNRYFWNELDKRKISETNWKFVGNKAWLAAVKVLGDESE